MPSMAPPDIPAFLAAVRQNRPRPEPVQVQFMVDAGLVHVTESESDLAAIDAVATHGGQANR